MWTGRKWIFRGENLFCGTISISFSARMHNFPSFLRREAQFTRYSVTSRRMRTSACARPSVRDRSTHLLPSLILERSWKSPRWLAQTPFIRAPNKIGSSHDDDGITLIARATDVPARFARREILTSAWILKTSTVACRWKKDDVKLPWKSGQKPRDSSVRFPRDLVPFIARPLFPN